jgi:AcrR family transcriptional regulator
MDLAPRYIACDTLSNIGYDRAVPTRRAELRASRRQTRAQIVSAATDLVRRMSFAELTVDEVMREAGMSRTIFYRHFDDLADLLVRAGREAIDELFEAQRAFGEAPIGDGPEAIRRAFVPAVAVYSRHGPLLRAIAEAAAEDEEIAAGQQAVRQRFTELAEAALRGMPDIAANPSTDLSETARALNLMNEAYLLDAFGRDARVPAETIVQTLTEIWMAVAHPGKERDDE